MLANGNPISDILTRVSSALDIPDYVYEDATIKYEDVGAWLGDDSSELKKYSPEIYPQGSFRLGTVVRPINGEDEYDIDLVCTLNLAKEQTTQDNLKTIVGNRLKLRPDFNSMLEQSRRCWTLNYPAQNSLPKFHMDILPSIHNLEDEPTGILLTDTELKLWQKSNPKAYAEWFYKRMEVIFLEKRAALAKSFNAKVEDVPEWQVKTPLQIAVQILKRHRDIYFQDQPDNKPISIIITTLAAKAYRGQADIYDALESIVQDMPKFIERKGDKWWVTNPVAEENFADKWNEYPERRTVFIMWLDRVRSDFATVKEQHITEMTKSLSPILGKSIMEKVAFDMGLSSGSTFLLTKQPQIPPLGKTDHCKPPIWPQNLLYKADISGSVHFNRKTLKKLWTISERPVPANVWLRFRVNTNVPAPYEIQWQIVNTGEEATKAGDLRGGFLAEGNNYSPYHWEHTLYKGTHWIEAFVIKDGVCLARTGRKFIKIR
ncbi:MAG: nucleotidyltransferase [Peptococcaceae bacterium]|jgi:hypothetical protein|nr:nucleotidyltransferase [Peptococcaceae bacterium]MDH7524429.1 nucleotidyltransferase [Peptococcaceae bacterium]